MLDIHFGIRREDVEAFDRILARDFENISTKTKWDNFNTWGPFPERLIGDSWGGDEDVIHMTVATVTPMVLLNYLVSRMFVFLNPVDDPESAFHGRFIVVTDSNNWSEYYVELCYPE